MAQGTLSRIVMVMALVVAFAGSTVLAQDFCWRDTSARGVGTIPTICPPGTIQDPTGALCYPPCPSGYSMVGPVCWQTCPADYVDTGALCHINRPLTAGGRWECTTRDAFGTCWWSELRCPAGYTNAGLFCALTTPPVPAGYSGATGLDLTKRTIPNGAGRIKNGCPGGLQNDAGLCYPACADGSSGVGPLCWTQPPFPAWINCGMGAAKDDRTCGMAVFDQVSSVGTIAINIASLGTSTGATAAASGATKLSKLTQLKQAYAAAKAANPQWAQRVEVAVQVKEKAEQAYTGYQILTTDAVPTDEDIARLAATIASLADPSGVTGAVAAYTYPVCSKLKPPILRSPGNVRIVN